MHHLKIFYTAKKKKNVKEKERMNAEAEKEKRKLQRKYGRDER